jgi:hypothetical protein
VYSWCVNRTARDGANELRVQTEVDMVANILKEVWRIFKIFPITFRNNGKYFSHTARPPNPPPTMTTQGMVGVSLRSQRREKLRNAKPELMLIDMQTLDL